SFPDSASKLSRGTKIVDFSLHSRSVEELSVKNLPPDQRIVVNIPITVGERGNTTLPAMQSVNAIQQSALKSIPVIYTTFNVSLVHMNIYCWLTVWLVLVGTFWVLASLKVPLT
ncbi:hypothetical protein OTU49_009244, partial [Cherax quadricarinatus]